MEFDEKWFRGWWEHLPENIPTDPHKVAEMAARAYGEHMMEPSPCGVEGHRMMDTLEAKYDFPADEIAEMGKLASCLACERERAHSLRVAEAVLEYVAENDNLEADFISVVRYRLPEIVAVVDAAREKREGQ